MMIHTDNSYRFVPGVLYQIIPGQAWYENEDYIDETINLRVLTGPRSAANRLIVGKNDILMCLSRTDLMVVFYDMRSGKILFERVKRFYPIEDDESLRIVEMI